MAGTQSYFVLALFLNYMFSVLTGCWETFCWCFQVPVSRMYRKRRYRLFRPRYDWTMIRDQVGETAYGNAVSSGKYLSGFAVCRGVCLSRAIGPSHFHPWWSYIICLQYLEIEVKNPRTHIENEKAQYTDYEIELKVRTWFDFLLLEGSILRVSSALYLRSEDSSFSCTGLCN